LALDCVVPARDEARTVAANVAAALACSAVREVLVVDDGSNDGTGELAAAAGAKVVRIDASAGSKAHALRAGVDASDADVLLFADADCLGLTGAHLDAIVEPVLAGRAGLSIGTFDYGRFLNPLVRRWPALSGERCLPRWLFDAIPAAKLDGYTVEVRINDEACRAGVPIVVRTMTGVTHRTKRDKFGTVEGLRRSWLMAGQLASTLRPLGDVDPRAVARYTRLLHAEGSASRQA
jgi:glycosyltransferase involved in cell wall biosynthesis